MKKTERMSWVGWVITLFFIGTPSIIQADMKEILSKFQPYITIEEEYNDNINLTARNRIDDTITTISPGLRFSTAPRSAITDQFRQTPTTEENYGMDLDFRAGFNFYAKEEDRNYVSLQGTTNAWYIVAQRLTFRLRDYLIRSEEGREREFSATAREDQYLLSTMRERAIYFRNVFEPSVEYQFGKEDRISINYRSNIYENQNPRFQDSREDYINPRFSYWFNIRHGISLDYGLTFGEFERSPGLLGHMAMGRYTYRFNPRTSIFGEYTFLKRDFDPPSIDYNVNRPSLGIEHAFSPTLSGRAQFGYFWENPERGSEIKGLFYDIGLSKRAEKTTYTLLFQGGYTEDYFTAENLGFAKYHRAIGTITHRLKERITLRLSSSFERAKYGDGRIDHIWGLGGDISYQILRWLLLSLDISHRQNNSNTEDRDYGENRAIFRVTATF